MTPEQVGLKVAFYLYPCILVVTLLGSQTFTFWCDRRRVKAGDAPSKPEPKDDAKNISKRWNAPVRWLQLILCILLVASIVVTIREAVNGRRVGNGSVEFPFSAYLV